MIVVAFTLPLLVSKHTLPLATFYGEWTAAVLAVMLVVAMAFASGTAAPARDRKGYPWVALLPVWLIVTTILQAASGMADITGSRLTTQLVLALGGVLMCMAWRMGQSMSTDQRAGVVDALAIAFLIAGLLGTLAQWVQVFHMEDQMLGLVSEYFYDTNRRLWGNLNQPNHQATVNGLALVAAVWLATRGWLRFPSWLVATLLLESGNGRLVERTRSHHRGMRARAPHVGEVAFAGACRSDDSRRMKRPARPAIHEIDSRRIRPADEKILGAVARIERQVEGELLRGGVVAHPLTLYRLDVPWRDQSRAGSVGFPESPISTGPSPR